MASEAIGRGFESLQARQSPCDEIGTLMGQRPNGATRGLSTSLRDGSDPFSLLLLAKSEGDALGMPRHACRLCDLVI